MVINIKYRFYIFLIFLLSSCSQNSSITSEPEIIKSDKNIYENINVSIMDGNNSIKIISDSLGDSKLYFSQLNSKYCILGKIIKTENIYNLIPTKSLSIGLEKSKNYGENVFNFLTHESLLKELGDVSINLIQEKGEKQKIELNSDTISFDIIDVEEANSKISTSLDFSQSDFPELYFDTLSFDNMMSQVVLIRYVNFDTLRFTIDSTKIELLNFYEKQKYQNKKIIVLERGNVPNGTFDDK